MATEQVALRIYWTGQLVDATVLRSRWFMRLVRWEICERDSYGQLRYVRNKCAWRPKWRLL